MSHSQQRAVLDMRRSQKPETPVSSRTNRLPRDCRRAKDKGPGSKRPTPNARTSWSSTDGERSSRTSSQRPWNRKQTYSALSSSACSTHHLPSRATETDRQGCTHFNDGDNCSMCCRSILMRDDRSVNASGNETYATKARTTTLDFCQPSNPTDDTPKPRFRCQWPNCEVSCSREGDLVRHHRSIHHERGDTTFECSYPGCEVRRARRDKVLEHFRKAHGNQSVRRPAIAFIECRTTQSKGEHGPTSRDEVNGPKDVEYAKPTADSQKSSDQSNQGAISPCPKALLLDPGPTALSPHGPGTNLDGQQDTVVQIASCATTANRPIPTKPLATLEQSSQNSPERAILGPKPSTFQKSGIRELIDHLESAAERRDNALSERPIYSSPRVPKVFSATLKSSTGKSPGHLNTTIAAGTQHVVPSSICETSPHDGDERGASATSHQHLTTSWNVAPGAGSSSVARSAALPEINADESNDPAGRNQAKRQKLSLDGEQMLLGCLGHHRDDPERDRFLRCKRTLKKFLSQLE